MNDDHEREVKKGVALLESMTEEERTKYAKELLIDALEEFRRGGPAGPVATAVMSCINVRIGDTFNQMTINLDRARAELQGDDENEDKPRRSVQ
jgi:uncharacterized OsmC-like protein